MKITYLGQAGLLFEVGEMKVMVDPYLSDSVEKVEPANRRRIPVETKWLEVRPDVLIFTHNHLDHYDPETVEKVLLPTSGITVLAPASVYHEVRKTGGMGRRSATSAPKCSFPESMPSTCKKRRDSLSRRLI